MVDHPIHLHLPLSTSRSSLLLACRSLQSNKQLASPLEPPRTHLPRQRSLAAQIITLNQTESLERTLVLFFVSSFIYSSRLTRLMPRTHDRALVFQTQRRIWTAICHEIFRRRGAIAVLRASDLRHVCHGIVFERIAYRQTRIR